MYLLDLSLGSIPLKIVPLCSDTLIPAPLPLLERVLEFLFLKPTKDILWFQLDLLHSQSNDPLAAASSLGRGSSRKGPNLVSKVDAEVWCGRETRALRELGEKVHCHHGAANCLRATVRVVFAECPPSDGEEHCSRTRCSRSGLWGQIQGAQLSNVEKHEHAFGRTVALPRLLRSWGSWALPLWRLLFSLRIIPIDLTLVPSDEAAVKESPLWQSGGDPAGIAECSL